VLLVRHLDGDVAVALDDPVAAPLGARLERLKVGASSTMIVATFSSSMSAPWLCSALAIADSSTFFTIRAAFLA
jgi:hypothetical protein